MICYAMWSLAGQQSLMLGNLPKNSPGPPARLISLPDPASEHRPAITEETEEGPGLVITKRRGLTLGRGGSDVHSLHLVDCPEHSPQ